LLKKTNMKIVIKRRVIFMPNDMLSFFYHCKHRMYGFESFRFTRLIFVLCLLIFFFSAKSQDPHFSQFYANPIYLAPSFAGSSQGARFVLNVRDQWPKIPGVFRTYGFSADHYISTLNSGLGVYMLSDNSGGGKLLTTNIGMAYSYKVKINKNFYFQPGLSAYYHSRTMQSDLTFSDMYSNGNYVGATSEVLPEVKVQHADFAISVMGYMEDYWFGANVDHLMSLSPILRSDFRYTNMKVSVFGGGRFHLKKRIRHKKDEYIHAAVNYQYQSSLHQLDLGGYYNRDPLVIGLWYRGIPLGNQYISPDALIYLLGIKYQDYTFSYSYDMSIGKLISHTGGSHEISIIYALGASGKIKPKRHKSIPCPEF